MSDRAICQFIVGENRCRCDQNNVTFSPVLNMMLCPIHERILFEDHIRQFITANITHLVMRFLTDRGQIVNNENAFYFERYRVFSEEIWEKMDIVRMEWPYDVPRNMARKICLLDFVFDHVSDVVHVPEQSDMFYENYQQLNCPQFSFGYQYMWDACFSENMDYIAMHQYQLTCYVWSHFMEDTTCGFRDYGAIHRHLLSTIEEDSDYEYDPHEEPVKEKCIYRCQIDTCYVCFSDDPVMDGLSMGCCSEDNTVCVKCQVEQMLVRYGQYEYFTNENAIEKIMSQVMQCNFCRKEFNCTKYYDDKDFMDVLIHALRERVIEEVFEREFDTTYQEVVSRETLIENE